MVRKKIIAHTFARKATSDDDELPRPALPVGKVQFEEPSNDDEVDKENVRTPQRHVNSVSAESSREMFRGTFSPTPSSGLVRSPGTFAPVSPALVTSTPYSTTVSTRMPSPRLDCEEMFSDQSSDGEQSLGSVNTNQSISSIIASLSDLLCSPSVARPSTSRREEGILANTAPSDMLKGVRAFVEVRCGKEDLSSGLMKLLERLGATVLKRMSHTVTHVVFRQGRRSTRKKAVQWNIPMVSALWVENCRVQKKRVSEADYPAKIPPALDEIPIKKFRIPKWARTPKETKEKVKRTNGSKKARPKKKGTPPPLTPPPLAIPDVCYNSPHERLSPASPVSQQPQNNPVPRPESPRTPRGRRSLRTVLLKLRAETFKNDCSVVTEEQPTKEGSPQPSAPCPPVLGEPNTPDPGVPSAVRNPVRRRQLFSQETPDGTPPSLIVAQTPPPAEHVSSFFDDEELLPLSERVKAERSSQSIGTVDDDEVPRINYYMYHMSSDESPAEPPEDGDTSSQGTAADNCSRRKRKRKRTSSDEKLRKKKKNKPSDNKVDKIDDGRSKLRTADPNGSNKQSSLEDFKMDVHRKHNLKALSWLNSSVDDSRQGAPSLVLTNVKASEEEAIRGVVEALGHFRIEEEVSQCTTHVVCGEKKRTLNMLFAMVQGCWILSPHWVYKSLESGEWLQEEPYEVAEYFPAVKLSRLQRGSSLMHRLFSDIGLVYVSPSSSPPCEKLKLLVQSAGGKVAQSYLRCDVAVGPVPAAKKFGAVTHVTEKWILDSISEHQALPLENYCT